MKTFINFLLAIFFVYPYFIVSSFSICIAEESLDTEVLNSASKDLFFYLEKIPIGHENNYGFHNREEFKLAKLGKPFQMYTIDSQFLISSAKTSKEVFIPLNEWRVPVVVKERYRALLTVSYHKKILKIVAFGASNLAAELENIEQKKISIILKQSKFKRLILRVYQLHSDFVLLTDNNPNLNIYNIFPLESASRFLNLKQKELGSSKTLINILYNKLIQLP